jgi:hypothetical protein
MTVMEQKHANKSPYEVTRNGAVIFEAGPMRHIEIFVDAYAAGFDRCSEVVGAKIRATHPE